MQDAGANPNVLPNEDPIPRMIQEMQDLNVEGEARGEALAAPQDPKIYFNACWERFKQENGDPFAAVRDAERNFRRENNGVPNENLNAAGVAPVSPRKIGIENKDRLNNLIREAYKSNPIYEELLDERKFLFKYTATNKDGSISGFVQKEKQELQRLYTNSDTNCVLIVVSSYAKLPQSQSMNPEFDVTIEDGRPAIWIGKFLDEIDDQIKIVYLQKIGKLALELRHSLGDINRDINEALKNFVDRLERAMNN